MSPDARAVQAGFFRGRIAPEYDLPAVRGLLAVIDQIPAEFAAEVLQAGRNAVTAVRLPTSEGPPLEIVVKSFGVRGWHRLKTLLVDSKARRAWTGARALVRAGLSTPAPIAYLESRKKGRIDRAFFLAARERGAEEIRGLLRRLPEAELGPLVSALARAIRGGHDAGVVHRDLSDGNVLVRRGADGSFRFLFLDTNRVKQRRRLGTLARARSLVRLGIPPALRMPFLAAYGGDQKPGALFVRWYGWSKAAFEGWLRIKKRLGLRRWAGKLKLQ